MPLSRSESTSSSVDFVDCKKEIKQEPIDPIDCEVEIKQEFDEKFEVKQELEETEAAPKRLLGTSPRGKLIRKNAVKRLSYHWFCMNTRIKILETFPKNVSNSIFAGQIICHFRI